MTPFEHITALLGIGSGLAGLVTWVLAHLTGLVKVLEGGNISVQQVADTVERIDPVLYAELQAKLKQFEDAARVEARDFEAAVQKAAAKRLQQLADSLSPMDAPAPEPVPLAPPANQ